MYLGPAEVGVMYLVHRAWDTCLVRVVTDLSMGTSHQKNFDLSNDDSDGG